MLATVVVPTYDHGLTLRHSVGSALTQTERDIEVLIVGDGVPPEARAVAEELASADGRVRFIDNEKGPGHGFRHRDAALAEARSDNVLYLCDDDLWLPDHVERLCELLAGAELVSAHKLSFSDGRPWLPRGPWDLGRPEVRARVLAGHPTLSMSGVGHTRDLYRRLTTGWRRDDWDWHALWREFAQAAGDRTAGCNSPTVVHLPDARRTGMDADERAAELGRIAGLLKDDRAREQLVRRLLELEVERSARHHAKLEGYADASRRSRRARLRARFSRR